MIKKRFIGLWYTPMIPPTFDAWSGWFLRFLRPKSFLGMTFLEFEDAEVLLVKQIQHNIFNIFIFCYRTMFSGMSNRTIYGSNMTYIFFFFVPKFFHHSAFCSSEGHKSSPVSISRSLKHLNIFGISHCSYIVMAKNHIYIYTVSEWWFQTCFSFSIQLGMSSSQLTLTPWCFRGVGSNHQPVTANLMGRFNHYKWWFKVYHQPVYPYAPWCWNIYQHLSHKSPKCRHIFHTWSIWVWQWLIMVNCDEWWLMVFTLWI